jgi:hypothetical protein
VVLALVPLLGPLTQLAGCPGRHGEVALAWLVVQPAEAAQVARSRPPSDAVSHRRVLKTSPLRSKRKGYRRRSYVREMSAGSEAALAGGIAGGVIAVVIVAVLVRLVAAVSKLGGVIHELVRAVEDLRNDEKPGDVEGAQEVAENGHRPGSTRVKLDLGLVGPVIKARALGRGTSEAARQLRRSRPGRPARERRKEP